MRIRDVRSIATAAVRDAANGAEFLDRAERVLGCKIELLSGQREARLSALGVISSIYKADGVVGDLGGGSLELTDVRDGECAPGVTLPLGGLSLMDLSERSPKKAAKIVREKLAGVKALQGLRRAHVLCRRRHLARSCAPAYAAAAVSDERDAQLRDPFARRARIRLAGRTDRGGRAAVDRSRSRRPAGRCWPTAPRCWRRSSDSPIRRRSSFPRSAFARG